MNMRYFLITTYLICINAIAGEQPPKAAVEVAINEAKHTSIVCREASQVYHPITREFQRTEHNECRDFEVLNYRNLITRADIANGLQAKLKFEISFIYRYQNRMDDNKWSDWVDSNETVFVVKKNGTWIAE
jgi:hypothetical protein